MSGVPVDAMRFDLWQTRRIIETTLPAELTDHLETAWRQRQKLFAARMMTPEAAEDTRWVSVVEKDLAITVHRKAAEHNLAVLQSSGPVWTFTRDTAYGVDPKPTPDFLRELPWTRGDFVPWGGMLTCRINAIAIPSLPITLPQDTTAPLGPSDPKDATQ